MLSLFGSGVGKGIAIGQAYVLKSDKIEVPHFSIDENDINAEIRRFDRALNATYKQYRSIKRNLNKDAPKETAAFIDAYLLILQDPLLVNEAKKIIQTEHVNAELALQQQAENLAKVFEQMEDSYLRNKKQDVMQISNRILRNLLGLSQHLLDEFNQEDMTGKIIIASDLSPAETMVLKDRKVAAFVTDLGSQISHTAIVARSLQIPAVVGMHGSSRYIQHDDLLIVDGKRGITLVNPEKGLLKQYRQLQRDLREREAALSKLIRRRSKTLDGKEIQLMANIESSNELRLTKKVNAAGVGLYRSEYLFMGQKEAPSEEQQFKAYKRLITNCGKLVIIRTLDMGGDKQPDFNYNNKQSSLSALGLRALRLCLQNMDLFIPQLRAILRASAFGKAAILLPMISNMDEVSQVLSIIDQTKKDLRNEGISYDRRIKIGGMIEVPAAAIIADQLAQKLDFLSIGTNDLIQYTLAIDRVDDAVNYLYDPIHPAVLNLIEHIIKAGKKADIPISLCGEMAGNINYTRLLLALGLRNFSMDPNYLLSVKEKVLETDTTKLQYQTNKIVRTDNPSQARDRLSKLNSL